MCLLAGMHGFNGTGAGNRFTPCVDIDECQTNYGGCSRFTNCINTVGSWYCGKQPTPTQSNFAVLSQLGCRSLLRFIVPCVIVQRPARSATLARRSTACRSAWSPAPCGPPRLASLWRALCSISRTRSEGRSSPSTCPVSIARSGFLAGTAACLCHSVVAVDGSFDPAHSCVPMQWRRATICWARSSSGTEWRANRDRCR